MQKYAYWMCGCVTCTAHIMQHEWTEFAAYNQQGTKFFFVIKINPTRVTVVLYLFNDHQNLLIWCQFDNLITLSMHCDPTYDYTMGDSMDSTIAGQTNGSNIRLVHRTHTCDGSTCSVHRCK